MNVSEDRRDDRARALREQVREKAKTIPERYRKTYVQAMNGKSKAAAVKAMCQECLGWATDPDDGSLPKQIGNCTILQGGQQCALYRVRPYQERKPKGGYAKAIKTQCIECMGANPKLKADRECIRDCASITCPLHPYRPYRKPARSSDKAACGETPNVAREPHLNAKRAPGTPSVEVPSNVQNSVPV